jgi:hypothetical protein
MVSRRANNGMQRTANSAAADADHYARLQNPEGT